MDSVSEISEDTTLCETASAANLEYNIQFIKKKIEDLREETVNNKNKFASASNDEDKLLKIMEEDDAESLANITQMETLRSNLESNRSKNSVLEKNMEEIDRELLELNEVAERKMAQITEERKRSDEKAKKVQKQLDNLNAFIIDLPNRFSREKLQAEIAAIRTDSNRVAQELSLMGQELAVLKSKLDNYPVRDLEVASATVLTETALRSYEEYVGRRGGQVHTLHQERNVVQQQIEQVEQEATRETEKELSELLGPNSEGYQRYEKPTHDS